MESVTRVAIYCRVSSERQESDGTSLDTQESSCRAWAEAKGWTIVHAKRETFSGFTLHGRPGMDELRDLIRSRAIDIVLAHAIDRLSRKQSHVAIIADECERHGVRLEFVTEVFEQSAVGEFMRSAKAFAAEVEREKIIERTGRGMRRRVDEGGLMGKRLPFGMQYTEEKDRRGRLAKRCAVEDPAKAPIVRRIYQETVSGKPLRAIARDLSADGIPTPNGKSIWNNRVIFGIVTHPFYKGTAYAFMEKTEPIPGTKKRRVTPRPKEEWVELPEGTVPEIVSPELWELVQAQLRRNTQTARRNNHNPEDSLLRAGFVYCAYCGCAMRVTRSTRRGKLRTSYTCQTAFRDPQRCTRHTIEAHILDDGVWATISDVLCEPGRLRAEVARIRKSRSDIADLEGMDRRIAALGRQIEAGAEKLVRFSDSPAVAAAIEVQLRNLDQERSELAKERAERAREAASWDETEALISDLEAAAPTLAAQLPNYTYAQKREWLHRLGVRVEVYRGDESFRWKLRSRWSDDLLVDTYHGSMANIIQNTGPSTVDELWAELRAEAEETAGLLATIRERKQRIGIPTG